MEHLDHPSSHFNDARMARCLLLRAFIIALGVWGIIVPFYTVKDSILDKINGTSGPPLPHFNDAKMARCLLFRAFIITLRGCRIIVPFYTVQDCSYQHLY